MVFKELLTPAGQVKFVPEDIEVVFPRSRDVGQDRAHLLAYIPWNNKYLQRVPEECRAFFQYILPHLRARTTNVHTATSLSFLPEMIKAEDNNIDAAVAHAALALHDCGWSQVGEVEIANSLDYRGLAYSGEEEAIAQAAKQLHDVLGERIARKVLEEFGSELGLTQAQRELVCECVRHHTFPRKHKPVDELPRELVLIHDSDRLWSYSYENFWQDTVRKNVLPATYAQNLGTAIAGYFLTEKGRNKAALLLAQRQEEVMELNIARA